MLATRVVVGQGITITWPIVNKVPSVNAELAWQERVSVVPHLGNRGKSYDDKFMNHVDIQRCDRVRRRQHHRRRRMIKLLHSTNNY